MNTTGWYQAIDHWTAMHNQQRLGGPMYFYIPLFLLYELPIFILALVGTVQFMTAGLHPVRFIRKVKNWIRERRFALPTGELAAITLQQFKDGQEREPEIRGVLPLLYRLDDCNDGLLCLRGGEGPVAHHRPAAADVLCCHL